MAQRTVVSVVLLALALCGIVLGVLALIARDRAELVTAFAAERQQNLERAIAGIEDSLDDVGDDLRFVGGLIGRASGVEAVGEGELRALLEVVGQYKSIATYRADGAPEVVLFDPRAPAALREERFLDELRQTALQALREAPGEIVTSAAIEGTGWFRVFATAAVGEGGGHAGAVAVLVDTEPLFSPLKLVGSPPETRLLLLGTRGVPLPLSDPTLAERVREASREGAPLPTVLEAIRSGRTGPLPLDETEAQALGLEGEAIATFTPIRARGGDPWAAATFVTRGALRSHEQAIIFRLTLAALCVALLLIAFGAYVLRAARREVALKESLRHADRVAQLQSQLLRAEKLATVGVLAAGIAHEVGTPLGVVRGRAEYVLGKLGADHSQRGGLQVILEQIDRISRTLRQLLDFSRVDAPLARAVPVTEVAAGLRELLRAEGHRRGLKLEVELEDGLPPVAANPDELQQVLVNLLLNACDASARGGTVRLEAARSPELPGMVTLRVRDEGCGIPREDLERIFDPFFTTKKRGEGTGLGLTTAAQIVRNHRGTIEASSEPGRGTCMTVTWPAAGPLAQQDEVRDAG